MLIRGHKMQRFQTKLWLWLAVLAFLSPIGIVFPRLFNAEDAWGEWGTETLDKLLGYVPAGLQRTADAWKAPFPDYSFGAMNSLLGETGSYVASALIGGLLVVLLAYLLARVCASREK